VRSRLRLLLPILFILLFMAPHLALAGKKPFVLKLATLATEDSDFMKSFHVMNQEIMKRTDKKVKLKAYTGNVMGKDAVVLRKIRMTGQVHGGSFTAGGASEVCSDTQIMSLPLLFKDYGEVDFVLERMDGALRAGLEKAGFVVLGWTETGFVYIMSHHPIAGLGDLKGKKIWVPENDPISQCTFKTAGVPPIPLPIPDVLTSLQTGLIDTVFNAPIYTILLQWFTKVKYLTYTPLIYAYGVVMVSKKYFDKIPAELRPVIKEVFSRGLKEIKEKTREGNREALETLEKKEGIQILPVSSEDYEELAGLADEANVKLEKNKVFSGELLRTLKAHLHEYRTRKTKAKPEDKETLQDKAAPQDKETPQDKTAPQGKETPKGEAAPQDDPTAKEEPGS